MTESRPDIVDVVENEARSGSTTTPGWYDDPDAAGRRYHDGRGWTQNYAPPSEVNHSIKTLLWGLSLGFGATGAVGVIAIPILAFYFPLGFGIGGLALAVAAFSSPGTSPWWSWVAVAASVGAILSGGSAYSDFQDISNQAQDALDGFGS